MTENMKAVRRLWADVQAELQETEPKAHEAMDWLNHAFPEAQKGEEIVKYWIVRKALSSVRKALASQPNADAQPSANEFAQAVGKDASSLQLKKNSKPFPRRSSKTQLMFCECSKPKEPEKVLVDQFPRKAPAKNVNAKDT